MYPITVRLMLSVAGKGSGQGWVGAVDISTLEWSLGGGLRIS